MPTLRRPRRPRRRYDTESAGKVVGRGLLVCAVLAVAGWFAVSLYSGVPLKDYTYRDALVPQVGSLLAHDAVRIGGVRVGQVDAIEAAGAGQVRLRLQLEPDVELPADTRIRLRGNGLLGARYVELVPGRSRARLAEGQAIRGDETTLTYGVTDALNTFDRETRGALKPLLGETGKGVLGQGRPVNDALRRGADAIGPFNGLLEELERNLGSVAALLPAMGSAAEPLDASRAELGRLFGATDAGLRPFVTRRDSVRATLDAAPGALDAARAAASAARPLLASARALSAEVRRTLPDAPPGLRATASLLRASHTPLARGASLLDAAQPALPAAERIVDDARPLLTPLREVATDLLPLLRATDRYRCDIQNFGAVFRSMTGMGGFGEGPGGPAMQFRLQVSGPMPTETLSLPSGSLLQRDAYPEPCAYLAKPYPIVDKPATSGRRGR